MVKIDLVRLPVHRVFTFGMLSLIIAMLLFGCGSTIISEEQAREIAQREVADINYPEQINNRDLAFKTIEENV